MKYKTSELLCLSFILGIYLIPTTILKTISKILSSLDEMTIPLAERLKL